MIAKASKKLGYVYGNMIAPSRSDLARKGKPEKPRKASPTKVLPASSGTGFLVSKSGHIVTNQNVVSGCSQVRVHHKGQQHPSTVVSVDQVNDLALIKTSYVSGGILKLSPSKPYVTQEIYVAGYPFGKSISASVKVTQGIVSLLGGIGNNFSNFQIDAALQPGNSGGPIVDDTGNVIGVAVAKLDLKKVLENWGVIPELTNFGIKASALETFPQGNSVTYETGSDKPMPKRQLAVHLTDNTLFLSCWMTMAQIEKLRAKKAMFTDLDE